MADSTKDEKPIKRAAQVILGSQAASRFTRTPITIEHDGSADELMKQLKKAGIKAYIEGGDIGVVPATDPNAVTGEYNPDTKHSIVTANAANPTLEDIKRTLFHEDIHAALDKGGYKFPDLATYMPSIYLHSDPSLKAAYALIAGQRAGNQTREAPAYVGAYSPTQMPAAEFSEGDRQRYLELMQKSLQPNPTLMNLYNRIVSNYNANPSASFGPLVPAGQ